MTTERRQVLLIAEAANPEWASVPRFTSQIAPGIRRVVERLRPPA
jgi:hypothetical protein